MYWYKRLLEGLAGKRIRPHADDRQPPQTSGAQLLRLEDQRGYFMLSQEVPVLHCLFFYDLTKIRHGREAGGTQMHACSESQERGETHEPSE
jgi:hypothetical protein